MQFLGAAFTFRLSGLEAAWESDPIFRAAVVTSGCRRNSWQTARTFSGTTLASSTGRNGRPALEGIAKGLKLRLAELVGCAELRSR